MEVATILDIADQRGTTQLFGAESILRMELGSYERFIMSEECETDDDDDDDDDDDGGGGGGGGRPGGDDDDDDEC